MPVLLQRRLISGSSLNPSRNNHGKEKSTPFNPSGPIFNGAAEWPAQRLCGVMARRRHLLMGGLVAMGFDAAGRYLLTVSHSGRGVFSTDTWERMARDATIAYPANGRAVGIGPIEGQAVGVVERDAGQDRMELRSPDGRFHLIGESDGIAVA